MKKKIDLLDHSITIIQEHGRLLHALPLAVHLDVFDFSGSPKSKNGLPLFGFDVYVFRAGLV